jgi:hypothetical protein
VRAMFVLWRTLGRGVELRWVVGDCRGGGWAIVVKLYV